MSSLQTQLSTNTQARKVSASWWLDVALLCLTLGGLFFILLGTRPLFNPDEGRYAEITREMVASGNYLTPYLNGIKYFEKPVLFYWLGAAAIKIAGLNLWSLRSINALLALLGCLFTYATARQLYDRATGLLSAVILGTSVLYFVMAHTISLDLTVTLFLMSCLYAFLLGTQTPFGIKRRGYLFGATIAAALAVLTKGLIGIVFPAIIVGTWIAMTGQWRLLKQLYLPSCLVIFLAITAPWHILVGLHNPEFTYFYFIEQHFLRYTTLDVGHYQPAWFFIPCLLLGFFPWSVFLPQVIFTHLPTSRKHSHYQTELFFLLWAVLIFAFFSFSKSKLIPYILPVFPPLAILTARYLLQAFHQKKQSGINISYICLLTLSAGIAYTFYQFTQTTLLPNPFYAKMDLRLAAMLLVSGMIMSCIYAYRHHFKKAVMITSITMGLFLLITLAGIPAIETRSILPLATLLKPMLRPQDDVITFNQYYQDLPFYLERRVSILNWRNELTYGMQHQDTHEWMINDETFWQRFHSHQRVFVIISNEQFAQLQQKYPHEKFYLLGKTINTTLISNTPPSSLLK